jgi:ribosomal protein L11 methyltransferase
MNFVAVKFNCSVDTAEMVVAALSTIGFDIFEERADGVDAYIDESLFDEANMHEILEMYNQPLPNGTLVIPKENWNELWEKNYDPIIVDDRCAVKAIFHKLDKQYPLEILVQPKMSFGTGHHATTFQMIKAQLDIDHKGKSVVDLGTGTGILAILAKKLGAKAVEATDIDEWCIENSTENFGLNGIRDIKVHLADAHNFKPGVTFDIVLANINKNVLLDEMRQYSSFCKKKGLLLLSGFYTEDIDDIEHAAAKFGFKVKAKSDRDRWAQLTLQKQVDD